MTNTSPPCAGYLRHPFVENDGFCERMSQVASTLSTLQNIPLKWDRTGLSLPFLKMGGCLNMRAEQTLLIVLSSHVSLQEGELVKSC